MNVLIVGLGLMGGAYAYKLLEKGYKIYGSDVNDLSVEFAINNKFICEGSTDPSELIKKSDLIVLAIYPQAIMDFLTRYNHLFTDKQVITDICGVKCSFIENAEKAAFPAKYVSHHPMAGREKVGIAFSAEVEFSGANFLITVTKNSNMEAVELLKKIGNDLGFGRITIMDVNKHDRMIGFTSQLTHAIAVSLVNSDHDNDTKNFIGDSYRDLTRIAKINENLWSELFLENKDYLLEHIQSFENELDKLKIALKNNDKDALKQLFRSSTRIRKEMDK